MNIERLFRVDKCSKAAYHLNMDDKKDKYSLIQACEFDPRYQNLVAAFQQALQRENIEKLNHQLSKDPVTA